MFMLTLKQKAALEVAKFVGWAALCGICATLAFTYVPFAILLLVAVGLMLVYALIMMYEMFLARLTVAEQIAADDKTTK